MTSEMIRRLAVAGLACLTWTLGVGASQASESVRAQTTSGWVIGQQEEGLERFLGLPYAAAPVDAYRWQPPQPAPVWTTDRVANAFAPVCPQVREPGDSKPVPPASEDCLYLNIWTPAADNQRRPVMVFVHGGAFMEGGTRGEYDGSGLAHRGNLVFVNLQYRIGALGFLELDQAGGAKYGSTGNLGILDQIAALRWIHTNIAAFGGDPDNVMLFGESAGAVSVATLMSLEQTRGLYSKALLESPRAPFSVTRKRAQRIAAQLIRLSGAGDFRHFRRLDWHAIMKAQEALFQARFEDTSFAPVLDGRVIKEAAQLCLLAGRGVRVPVVFGTNLEELKFWELGEGLPLSGYSRELLRSALQPLMGERSGAIIDLYRRETPDHTPESGNILLLSDLTFRLASIRLAEAHARASPTWMYLFSYRGGPFGAGHAAELPFVFAKASAPSGSLGTQAQRSALQNQIQDTWIAFARNGDPNHAGLRLWPPYEASQRATLELGLDTHVTNDPYSSLRQAWDNVPFDGLTPDIDQASGLMTIGGGGTYWKWTAADQ